MKCQFTTVAFLSVIILSTCSNPMSDTGSGSLELEYSSVTIAANSYLSIGVKGGTRPYRIKSISDSNKVAVSLSGYLYAGLLLEGKAIGSAEIIVEDSLGAIGKITISVTDFTAFPSSLTMYRGEIRQVRFFGGQFPFSIELQTDTTIAKVIDTSSCDYIIAISEGAATIVIKDSSSPSRRFVLTVKVVPKQSPTKGKISFSSSIGNFNIEGVDPIFAYPNARYNSFASGLVFSDWFTTRCFAYLRGIEFQAPNYSSEVNLSLYQWNRRIQSGNYPIGTWNDFSGHTSEFIYFPPHHDTSKFSNWFKLTDGEITVENYNSNLMQGRFSGSGYAASSNGIDTLKPFVVYTGTFEVPIVEQPFDNYIYRYFFP